jgi:hypothetical protein
MKDKWGRLKNAKSDLCIDLTGTGENNDMLVLNKCDNAEFKQLWKMNDDMNIMNYKNNKCIAPISFSADFNDANKIFTCDSKDYQLWTLKDSLPTGEYINIINNKNKLCLTPNTNDAKYDDTLVLNHCSEDVLQKWKFIPN